ncbi:hypothetical protein [Streptomyces sp. MP131-18]|uniref:hypothetical protein n=1 Tax=Streptomyces sp. MP131-18 TaxID=1857892 RepID=UPI00097C5E0E|nr:hypothetical protein [Streptomyces sp. MP131-18]ONK11665.1 hypothetical protein STBA_24000 [Streptomyces sp. MP131-18]
MTLSDFPRDLVRDQRDWNRTYAALAQAGPVGQTSLRRRLIRLSARLAFHPFWNADRPSATPAELRHQVRVQERREGGRAA